ncbi:MAG: TonB-dependent receptor [Saprospiraceae bacterium]|nr:TonB-dependent receptor [Saprospiraceae bacterium]
MKKVLLCISLVVSVCHKTLSQTESKLTLDSAFTQNLDEIIFSASKQEEKKSEQAQSVKLILSKEIQFLNPQNTADMLSNSGSVFVQKSQQGGGSPSIRGFEASRVLIVIDGIRMNNAIYRSGHLQDVLTIDPNLLERTEILFGPSSTMYGSDALGGVMHFYTRKPKFIEETSKQFQAQAYTRWSSANNESTSHVNINIGRKKWASLSGITYSLFDDLRAGKNRNPFYDSTFLRREYVQRIDGIDSLIANDNFSKQVFSGYKQLDLFQKISYRQNRFVTHIFNIQYSTSSDIPRYDRLTEYSNGALRFAEWNYGPQKRLLAALQSEIHSVKLFDNMNVSLSYQDINQERVSRRYRNENRFTQQENVKVFAINLDAQKKINAVNRIGYGLEIVHNKVSSNAKSKNINTDQISSAATRYPDGGSMMNNYAAYLNHHWTINSKIRIHEGLRYNFSNLHSRFVNKSFFPFPFNEIKQNNKAITGNLGFVYDIRSSLRFSVLVASGFRTPNVDDLTKIFESSKGILIVANADLKPEYTFNIEAGIDLKISENHSISFQTWNTNLFNAMVLKNYKYNGLDSIDYDGVKSQIQAMQNVDKGRIQGVSANYKIKLTANYILSSSLTYTVGKYKNVINDTLIPLDHISPLFGRISMMYIFPKYQLEIYSLYNGWKRLHDYSPSGEDNLQYATSQGTPSWMTLNMKGSYNLNSYVSIQAGIENMLDKHYRFFASGISAPGRNVYLTLRANL